MMDEILVGVVRNRGRIEQDGPAGAFEQKPTVSMTGSVLAQSSGKTSSIKYVPFGIMCLWGSNEMCDNVSS